MALDAICLSAVLHELRQVVTATSDGALCAEEAAAYLAHG